MPRMLSHHRIALPTVRPPHVRTPCPEGRRADRAPQAAQPLGGLAAFASPRCASTKAVSATCRARLRDDGGTAQLLFPGLPVTLYRDEGEGYYLNLDIGHAGVVRDVAHRRRRPVARLARTGDAVVQRGRRACSMPRSASTTCRCRAEVREWLQAFADEHYRPEPKRRRRPASFRRARTALTLAMDDQDGGFLSRWSRRKAARARRSTRGRGAAPAVAAAQAGVGAAAAGAAAARHATLRHPRRRRKTPGTRRPAADAGRRGAADARLRLLALRRTAVSMPGAQRGAEQAVQRPALQRHGRAGHLHRRLQHARPVAARHAAPDDPIRSAGPVQDRAATPSAAPATHRKPRPR